MSTWGAIHRGDQLGTYKDVFIERVIDTGDGLVCASAVVPFMAYGCVTKIGYDGVTQWQRTTDGLTPFITIESDANGNIYVLTGFGLTKFSSTGTLLWHKNTTAGGADWSALLVMPDGKPAAVTDARSAGNLSLVSFAASGSGADEYFRPMQTDEAWSTQHLCSGTTGEIWQASSITTGDDAVMLTLLYLSTSLTPTTKKFSVTGHSFSAAGVCRLSTGDIIFIAKDTTDTGVLHIVSYNGGGSVNWSKEFSDSGIADFSGVSAKLGAIGDEFIMTLDVVGAPLYKFANDGSLVWQRKLSVTGSTTSWADCAPILLSDSSILLGQTMDDADGMTSVGMLFKLYADGTPTGAFGNGRVAVDVIASGAVNAGLTFTVSNGPSFAVTKTSAIPLSVPSSSFSAGSVEVAKITSDQMQSAPLTGRLAVIHGQPCSPYTQTSVVAGGLVTKHGVAMSMVRMPSSTTICATQGVKATKHGTAAGASHYAAVTAGQLVTKHGAANSKASYSVVGTLSISHGEASFASLFRATGSRVTKHGVATVLLSRVMTGHLATRHGAAASEYRAEGQATGHLVTRHGTASFKCVFRVVPTFKTRHGTPKLNRSLTC